MIYNDKLVAFDNETNTALGQFEQRYQKYEQQHFQEQSVSPASIAQDLEQMGEMIDMLTAVIEALPTSEK